jgi:BirA family biotin operon repressor/biotin-[acetyl-CoA-carboxylase] ligase
MACAVADAGGDAAGATLDVKWPNDVLHGGRKLCGVLAESRALSPGAPPVLVVGAGVNVNQLKGDFPADLRPRATSLRIAAGGREIEIPALFGATLARYEPYVALARDGAAGALFDRVRPRLPANGAPVRLLQGGRVVDGVVEDVVETGALRVRERSSGVVETVSVGDLV